MVTADESQTQRETQAQRKMVGAYLADEATPGEGVGTRHHNKGKRFRAYSTLNKSNSGGDCVQPLQPRAIP